MTLYLRLVIAALIAGALWFAWDELISHYDKQGYDRARAEDKAATEKMAERNRELARAAELKYVVTREAQDRFRVVTVREVHDASAPLASCVLPEPVRLRLNEAARCARGDSAAPGCTPNEVPHP